MNEQPLSSYDDWWKTIDSLEQKGLPESALAKTQELLELVKQDKNNAQFVKCLIYKTRYQIQLGEDGMFDAITILEQERDQAGFPQDAILNSILGQLYDNYLSNNFWRLRDRTDLAQDNSTDFKTWSVAKLFRTSQKLYLKSVEDDRLQKIKLSEYEAILGSKEEQKLRSTLYDLLAHRAEDYLMNEKNYVTEPAYAFKLDNVAAFAVTREFVSHQFSTEDSLSTKWHTLKLFQDLESFHQDMGNEYSLVDVYLKRMSFVKNNLVLENKLETYITQLEKAKTGLNEANAKALITNAIAQGYFERGGNYQKEIGPKYKEDWIKARDLCLEVIEQYDDDYSKKQAEALMSQIEMKELSFMTEQVELPNQSILAKVSFRNVEKLFLRVSKITYEQLDQFKNLRGDEYANFLRNLDPVKSWSLDLPTEGDYRNHSTEFKIDGLDLGVYMVLVADNPRFSGDKNHLSYSVLQVSNISYLSRGLEKGSREFVMVHRDTGEPLEGVKGTFFRNEYNSKKRRSELIEVGSSTSDVRGFMKAKIARNRSFTAVFELGRDQLNLENYYSTYGYEPRKDSYDQTHIFLDRKIYRPGQTIYYKALVTRATTDEVPVIQPNKNIEVVFRDANGQEVGKQNLRTNEYGTINGSFTAPLTGRLGYMSIVTNAGGSESFSVEEYKRPKFEVSFSPVEEAFKLNDEVEVSGVAKAYAGSNIDGAKVQYRVVREVRYPYLPWYYRRWFPPYRSTEMEITSGVTTTDDKGEFTVNFKAIPDPSIEKKNKPIFRYTIYADVTDVTGETRSAEGTVSVGYVALDISLDLPEIINKEKFEKIEIRSKNLNGQFEKAEGKLTIQELKSPDIIYKKRRWSKPDTYLMTQEDFKNNFPTISYQDEDEVQNWEKGRMILNEDFNTEVSATIQIGKILIDPGKYLVNLETKDKYGEEIKLEKILTVYDLQSTKVPANETHFLVQEKNSFEPGENAELYFGSAYNEINVLYEIEEKYELTKSDWMNVSNLKKEMVTIQEEHRGNIHYSLHFVKHNRHYVFNKTLSIPWTNKELTFEYGTFRDKLLPGQDEEWRIKVSGSKKDMVMAEMLATMYDASLDAFASNDFRLNLFPRFYNRRTLQESGFNNARSNSLATDWNEYKANPYRNYPSLNLFDLGYAQFRSRRMMRMQAESAGISAEDVEVASAPMMESKVLSADAEVDAVMVESDAPPTNEPQDDGGGEQEQKQDEIPIRTNLKETVFFFPELKTDADGNVLIKFKMNEALTRWKFLGLAHTTGLDFGITSKEIITQKELMVQPNPPRFFREMDEIEFTAKVTNLSDGDLSGTAELQLLDAITMQPVDQLLGNTNAEQSFDVKKDLSTGLSWKLNIPVGKVNSILHRVVARATNANGSSYSDGEEDALPVLTNRMLVTETLPLPVKGNTSKTFDFKRMSELANSNTLQHHSYTLEFTSNPAWYAVQALPYLMEYPYECIEQIFNRYYANTLASSVANSHPKIARVFEQWKNTDALESNLSKNQELKTALLEETPWVLDAQNEAQQKKNIGLLFDLNRMAYERDKAIDKLTQRQLSNGGFPWFAGGRDNWYITQYVMEGMGHLNELNVKDVQADQKVSQMVNSALSYIDDRMFEHYEKLLERIKRNKGDLDQDHLDGMAIHYLYARSFFLDQPIANKTMDAVEYYLGQSEKYWVERSVYMQGMIGLALHRFDRNKETGNIIKSLKERAIKNNELGMYWKYNAGYFWYELPLETQALMIEFFDEVGKDNESVEEMKIWLLKAKQTTNWKTTKATAAAVYALLRVGETGSNWILEDKLVDIKVGNEKVTPPANTAEAGTGYFKTKWDASDISNSMATIKVDNPNDVVSWGGVYWQYFEQLDKITTFEETPLKLNKKMFKEVNTDRGPVLEAISENAELAPGDKLKVRIELEVDRPMEYVHMKDTRASGFEPINVLSSYKWQGGLGYYESTKDASTNFFIGFLPRGTYVFEYPLRVVHRGDFSNGITSIQCMYAPEFSSHSEGIRVQVK